MELYRTRTAAMLVMMKTNGDGVVAAALPLPLTSMLLNDPSKQGISTIPQRRIRVPWHAFGNRSKTSNGKWSLARCLVGVAFFYTTTTHSIREAVYHTGVERQFDRTFGFATCRAVWHPMDANPFPCRDPLLEKRKGTRVCALESQR